MQVMQSPSPSQNLWLWGWFWCRWSEDSIGVCISDPNLSFSGFRIERCQNPRGMIGSRIYESLGGDDQFYYDTINNFGEFHDSLPMVVLSNQTQPSQILHSPQHVPRQHRSHPHHQRICRLGSRYLRLHHYHHNPKKNFLHHHRLHQLLLVSTMKNHRFQPN